MLCIRCRTKRISRIEERGKHPHFHELDIGCLKIVGIQCPHNASPALLRVAQQDLRPGDFNPACIARITIGRIKVVGSTLIRIEREVKSLHIGQLVGCHVEVGEYLLLRNDTRIGVILVRVVPRKGVEAIPVDERAISARHQALFPGFRKERIVVIFVIARDTGDKPLIDRLSQIDAGSRPLEVIDIDNSLLIIAILVDCPGMSGFQISRLRCKIDIGRHIGAVERQQVDEARQEGRLPADVYVQPHDAVADRVIANIHLRREGTLEQLQIGSSDVEIFAHLIVSPKSHHGLRLKAEERIILIRNIDRNP